MALPRCSANFRGASERWRAKRGICQLLHATGPAKRKKRPPRGRRGEERTAEAEQCPVQSERLSQLSESLPQWRIRCSGGGAERFVAPFVILAAKPDWWVNGGGRSEARQPWRRDAAPQRPSGRDFKSGNYPPAYGGERVVVMVLAYH